MVAVSVMAQRIRGAVMAPDLLDRITRATNAHDLDALVDCFDLEYRNETPAHPARGFTGREQVRRNWQQIFAGVPDVQVRVLGRAADGDTLWSELEMSGTRRDATPFLMRGVVVYRLRGERAVAARFYLEPVDDASADVNTVVTGFVHAPVEP
jgi:ketosteroid isomerase-like protein